MAEGGAAWGVTEVGRQVSTIGKVKLEGLNVIAFLPAKVLGNAQIRLEGI
jgi:hypothetical protein